MGYIEIIREQLSEIEILSHYLNISESEIRRCLSTGKLVNNPTRIDGNPSLGFMYTNKGKILVTDFGKPDFKGDVLAIVGKVLNKDCNDRDNFIDICEDIIHNLIGNASIPIVHLKEYHKHKVKETKTIINVTFRDVAKEDYKYWKPLGVNPLNLAGHYVFPVNSAAIIKNDIFKMLYVYSQNDRCYAYYLGTYSGIAHYQLYFPDRDKSKRFITNSYLPIHSPFELTTGDILCITKSRKDCILLREIIKRLTAKHKWDKIIHVTNFSSESITMSKVLYESLKARYPEIYLFMDNDLAGYKNLIIHRNLYHTKSIVISRALGVKDISSFTLKYGIESTMEEVNNYYNLNINER